MKKKQPVRELKKIKLTIKEEKFCLNWLDHGNGTKAAVDAGYSKRCAHVTSTNLLKKPNIVKFISDIRSQNVKRAKLSMFMITQEFAKIGFAKKPLVGDIQISGKDKVKALENLKEIVEKGTEISDETIEVEFDV